MELKLGNFVEIEKMFYLLIVPYGIETTKKTVEIHQSVNF